MRHLSFDQKLQWAPTTAPRIKPAKNMSSFQFERPEGTREGKGGEVLIAVTTRKKAASDVQTRLDLEGHLRSAQVRSS